MPAPSPEIAAGREVAGVATRAGRTARLAARFGPRAVLAGVALFLVAVPFGLLLLLVEASWEPMRRLDEGASRALHQYAVGHPAFVWVMKAISFAGSAEVYLPLFAVTAVALLMVRKPRLALFVSLTSAGGGLLNTAVKAAVGRARPALPDPVSHAGGWSFPSGHAQGAVVTYLLLLVVLLPVLPRSLRPVATAGAVVMVAAIGFSRIALGVHYISDVLAGYALGGAWVVVNAACFGIWQVAGHGREAGQGGPAPG